MQEKSYNLKELCQAANVTERTVRFYIKEGLLPPPEGPRAFSRYSYEHWLRLKIIRQLKESYFPLREIQQLIGHKTVAELENLASQKRPNSLEDKNMLAELDSDQTTLPLIMLEEQAFGFAQPHQGISMTTQAETPARPGLNKLFNRPPITEHNHQAQGEIWERVIIEPGVELHLAGEIAERHREKLDTLLKELRRVFSE
jgi:DNA-binding transcriptional MerR regulator